MASITTTFQDGEQVEVGMFGFESIIGVSALMGTKRSLNRVYTQIEGRGYSSPIEAARLEFSRGGVFQMLALRYVQAQLIQVMQSAGCNARHNLEQRLARWLLICADRAQVNTFRMSHEYLSHMLGVRRATISESAAKLKQSGLIKYTGGFMHVVDADKLEERSCECYRVIKNHLDNYAEFDSGITE
jgi:CRP-like cAMP-binding protein